MLCGAPARDSQQTKNTWRRRLPSPRIAPQALFAEVLGSPLGPPPRNFFSLSNRRYRNHASSAVSQPATQPCDRGFMNVQALKEATHFFLLLRPTGARQPQTKNARRAALADKTPRGYPILAHGGGAGPRGPKSLPFTYKMNCNFSVSLSVTI